MKILFYNSSSAGHQFEYIDYLVNVADTFNFTAIFYVSQKFEYRWEGIKYPNLRIYFIDESEIESWKKGGIFYEHIKKEILFINACHTTHQIDHIFLFNMEQYQMHFNAFLSNSIFGILFRPYNVIPSNLNFGLLKLRKFILNYILLNNKKLRIVFVLNSKISIQKFKNSIFFNSEKFHLLHDPVNRIGYSEKVNSKNISEKFNILIFGYINNRKSIHHLLDSLQYVSAEVIQKISINIIGEWDIKYKEEISDKLAEYTHCINLDERFISYEQLHSAVEESSILYICYEDSFYSSGIQGLASLHKKPSIVPKYGVMSHYAIEYRLGLIADPYNHKDIASKLVQIYKEYNDIVKKANFEEYLKCNDKESFTNCIKQGINKITIQK